MKYRYRNVILVFVSGFVVISLLASCRFSAKKTETIKAVLATEQEQERAVQSVKKFLAEIDSENGQTWDQLSQTLKASTSQMAWSAIVTTMKAACGRKVSRGSARSVCTDELPDSPPGRYFVFEIPTKFERADLTERVVLILENEEWKVAGYFRKKTIVFKDDSNGA